MKKLALSLIIFILYIYSAYSQINDPISYGLNAAIKSGVSVVETPIGRQNGLSINQYPDINLSLYIPLTETSPLGTITDLGLNNYSYLIKDFATGKKYTNSFSYIGLSQSLFFKGITFGFGINFPISYDIDGATQNLDNVNTIIDLKFGYNYTIYKDESAKFAIFIKAYYQLNGNFSDFTKNDPFKTLIPEVTGYPINNSHTPRAAALAIGFAYYFLNQTKND